MKQIVTLCLIFLTLIANSQVIKRTETTTYDEKGNIPTKTNIITEETKTEELQGVTFGIGMGWSYLFENPKDYFLTTDATHKLQIQDLSRSSIVISSVISIKLGKLSLQTQSNGSNSKKVLVSTNRIINKGIRATNNYTAEEDGVSNAKPNFHERLAINVSLNLAELNGGNIAFNKSIDGGIGMGYYFNQFTQIAVFFDMLRVRQMRDYFTKKFEGDSIPNGAEIYNALDQNNNNLFYNKYFPGVSIKAVFSLGNKK